MSSSVPAAIAVGPAEIIIVLVIVLLLFGAKRIPEVGRSLGQGMREFKDSVTGKDRHDQHDELEASTEVDPTGSAEGERDPAATGRPGSPRDAGS